MESNFFCKLCILLTSTLLLSNIVVESYQYKVGDLDSWGVPPPTKSNLYSSWSSAHHFKPGDSLMFLYPPSQDSVLQVTEKAYKECSTSDPITKMDDGNSLFNITTPGNYYFISGAKGHCEKKQKMVIQVASADGKFFPPSADAGAPAVGPSSYSNAFGPMPMGLGSGTSAAWIGARPLRFVGSIVVGVVVWVLL